MRFILLHIGLLRSTKTVFFILWVAISTIACSPDPSAMLGTSTLNRGLSGEPESLDPQKNTSNQSQTILRDIGEGLVSFGADGTLSPGVAKRWEQSEDGLTYIFHLRADARWSNGRAVTAKDFEFAFQRLVNPQTAAPYAEFLSGIKNANDIVKGKLPPDQLGATAIDTYIFQIQLRTKTPHFLQLLAHPSTFPIERKSFEQLGTGLFRPGSHVSNGAYVLLDWIVGSTILLQRNESYWASQTTDIDRVVYHFVDQNAEFDRYRAGEIDITASVPESAFPMVREEMRSELRVSPYLGIYYYGFNLTRGLFAKNKKLRQALSMAIDRQALVDRITGRGEVPAYSWVPPGVNLYGQNDYDFASLEKHEREEQARQLFADAGFNSGDGLEFELRYNTFDGNQKIAVAIQSMWRGVLGVRATLVNEEFKVFIDTVRSKEHTEAFRLSWTGDYNDAYSFLQLFKTDNPSNLTGYSNPNFDHVVSLAENEPESVARREYLEKAERIAMADFPVIPLYFYVSKHLIKPSIAGWENNVMDIHLSRYLSVNSSDEAR